MCEDAAQVYNSDNITQAITLKGCMAIQWCPAENSLSRTTHLADLIGQTHKRIQFRSSITFPLLSPSKKYST